MIKYYKDMARQDWYPIHGYRLHTINIVTADTTVRPSIIKLTLFSTALRCMSNLKNGEIIMKSRVGKEFKKMPHLITQLGRLFKIATDLGYPDLYVDGELYSDEIPFEEISGLVTTIASSAK